MSLSEILFERDCLLLKNEDLTINECLVFILLVGGFNMGTFEILVGSASIGSFIVAIIALIKVSKVEKVISNKAKQIVENTNIENGSIVQSGRDYRSK